MPRPATLRWGGPGVRVTDFELRNRGNGRIYANGLLPTEGVGRLPARRRQLPGRRTSSTSLQTRHRPARASLTLHGTMTGTLSAPAFRGAFGARRTAMYNETRRSRSARRDSATRIDELVDARRRAAAANGPARWRRSTDGFRSTSALSGVTGSRVAAAPMSVDLVGRQPAARAHSAVHRSSCRTCTGGRPARSRCAGRCKRPIARRRASRSSTGR